MRLTCVPITKENQVIEIHSRLTKGNKIKVLPTKGGVNMLSAVTGTGRQTPLTPRTNAGFKQSKGDFLLSPACSRILFC